MGVVSEGREACPDCGDLGIVPAVGGGYGGDAEPDMEPCRNPVHDDTHSADGPGAGDTGSVARPGGTESVWVSVLGDEPELVEAEVSDVSNPAPAHEGYPQNSKDAVNVAAGDVPNDYQPVDDLDWWWDEVREAVHDLHMALQSVAGGLRGFDTYDTDYMPKRARWCREQAESAVRRYQPIIDKLYDAATDRASSTRSARPGDEESVHLCACGHGVMDHSQDDRRQVCACCDCPRFRPAHNPSPGQEKR